MLTQFGLRKKISAPPFHRSCAGNPQCSQHFNSAEVFQPPFQFRREHFKKNISYSNLRAYKHLTEVRPSFPPHPSQSYTYQYFCYSLLSIVRSNSFLAIHNSIYASFATLIPSLTSAHIEQRFKMLQFWQARDTSLSKGCSVTLTIKPHSSPPCGLLFARLLQPASLDMVAPRQRGEPPRSTGLKGSAQYVPQCSFGKVSHPGGKVHPRTQTPWCAKLPKAAVHITKSTQIH